MIAEQVAQKYREASEYFFTTVEQVTSGNLDNCHPEGWSARQIIHHMADSEVQSYARLRRLLAEPEGSTIQGYDESAWATCDALGYRELDIEPSLVVIRAVRHSSTLIISRLTESDFSRCGIHTESGRYTVSDWLTIYTAHPREHGDQLLRAIQGQK